MPEVRPMQLAQEHMLALKQLYDQAPHEMMRQSIIGAAQLVWSKSQDIPNTESDEVWEDPQGNTYVGCKMNRQQRRKMKLRRRDGNHNPQSA